MLRMVDSLRSHGAYRRASSLIVHTFLKIHRETPKPGGAGGVLPDMSNMSATEKKKLKAKARKDAKRKAAEQEEEKRKMMEEVKLQLLAV
ncbi:unnamed protein product [Discosporangium mesarthrocarpum]